MSSWKDDMIIKQEQELYIENEDNPWILESQTMISKMGSQNASTAISMGIWQRNIEKRKRKT